jgi:glycerol kinase
MVDASGQDLAELRVDGGASVMDLLLHFQADLLGVPVVRAAVHETTALGAALLAGLAEGIWASVDEIARNWRPAATLEPADDRTLADVAYRGWQKAVQRSRAWAPRTSEEAAE